MNADVKFVNKEFGVTVQVEWLNTRGYVEKLQLYMMNRTSPDCALCIQYEKSPGYFVPGGELHVSDFTRKSVRSLIVKSFSLQGRIEAKKLEHVIDLLLQAKRKLVYRNQLVLALSTKE